MKLTIRLLNVAVAPVLAFYFAGRFGAIPAMTGELPKVLGGIVAGVIVILVELAVSHLPKASYWVRRWVNPRALFEGAWTQEVRGAPPDNALSFYSFQYDRQADAYYVVGRVYSPDGHVSYTWESTHLFFSKDGHTATYLWKGERLGTPQTPEEDKRGLAEITLRHPGRRPLPVYGTGRVFHLNEEVRFAFIVRRVTLAMLRDENLKFRVRDLLQNARNEEFALIQSLLLKYPWQEGESNTSDIESRARARS